MYKNGFFRPWLSGARSAFLATSVQKIIAHAFTPGAVRLTLQRSLIVVLSLFPFATLASTSELGSLGGQALDYTRGTSYFRIAVLLTLLSFIPAIVIATTAFTRIIIVLSSVRFGLGMQETPPNIVLITLAMFLTSYIMMPTFTEIKKQALDPYLQGSISSSQFIDQAAKPLEKFMLEHTREQDLAAIEQMSGREVNVDKGPDLIQLIPAFMLSELRVAFQMAFMVLLPFLLIDLVVAVTLMSLGMMMVPPATISLPLKILMFVLVDGWIVLARSLIDSYAV